MATPEETCRAVREAIRSATSDGHHADGHEANSRIIEALQRLDDFDAKVVKAIERNALAIRGILEQAR